MAWLWQNFFRKKRTDHCDLSAVDSLDNKGWDIASRPDHGTRFAELQRTLVQEVFVQSDPKRSAYFLIAGLLNQQLAIMQSAHILDIHGEACLRMPFSLGYIFGVSAWSADKYGMSHPSTEADEIVVLAYQEVLGPLSSENISQLSKNAPQWPEFQEGIECGARDGMQVAKQLIGGATGLVEFVAKCRLHPNANMRN